MLSFLSVLQAIISAHLYLAVFVRHICWRRNSSYIIFIWHICPAHHFSQRASSGILKLCRCSQRPSLSNLKLFNMPKLCVFICSLVSNTPIFLICYVLEMVVSWNNGWCVRDTVHAGFNLLFRFFIFIFFYSANDPKSPWVRKNI